VHVERMVGSVKRFDRRLHVLVTEDEHEMLADLATREGLSPSDMIRQLIRRAHAASPSAQATTVPKPKPRKRKTSRA